MNQQPITYLEAPMATLTSHAMLIPWGLFAQRTGLVKALESVPIPRYFPIKMRIIDTRAKMTYGHSTSLRREVNDRTKRDPGLFGGNVGRVVGWRASASACSRVETAAEKTAGETAKTIEGQNGEAI
jgi:hypothetical protein